jgi:hypothetical protein
MGHGRWAREWRALSRKHSTTLRTLLHWLGRLLFCIAALLVIALVAWIVTNWNDPSVVGFASTWLPAALSLVVAFMPSQEKGWGKHMIWRAALIVAGVAGSALMWHNQKLALATAKQEQEQAISKAAAMASDKSNAHTDQQISGVKEEIHNVAKVSATGLEEVRSDLRGTTSSLSTLISKGALELNDNINKVKPPAPKQARLQFSFFTEDQKAFPILVRDVQQADDKTFSVDFSVRNISDVVVKEGDIWIILCDACKYEKEPDGFTKPKGSSERYRNRHFNILNPGVTLDKMTVTFSITGRFYQFGLALKYACENCVNLSDSQQMITGNAIYK